MPTITQRANGSWQAKVRLAGFEPVSDVFDSKSKASAWGYAKEAELRAMRKGVAKATLQDTIDRYRKEVCPEMKSGANVSLRLKSLSATPGLLPVLRQVNEVTAADLSRFRDIRAAQVKPATVLKELAILSGVFESARRDWGTILANPLADVKKPPQPPARKRLFTDSEIDLVLDGLGYQPTGRPESMGQQAGLALLLALETAMRASEMLGLEWSRVFLEKRYVTLGETKNGDARDVSLSKVAVALLERMKGLDETMVFTLQPATLDVVFRRARDKLKLKDLHFHDSRATAVTRLAQKLSIHDLARMIGHRDLNSLLLYYRKNATDIASSLD
jgi:integrase